MKKTFGRLGMRFAMVAILTLSAVVAIFAFAPNKQALAANPTTINFQGKVTNANGTNESACTTTCSIIFRIYNTASPVTTTTCTTTASCLWEETQSSLTLTNGVFQVNLGAVCALTSASCNNSASGGIPANWSASSLFLTMQFNGDAAGFMSPTIKIQSVPFAFNADTATHLDAGTVTTLGVGDVNATAITIGNTTNSSILFKTKYTAAALQVQNAGGNEVLTIDTSATEANNFVRLGKPSTINGRIVFDNSTNANIITLVSGATAASGGSGYSLTLPTTGGSGTQCLQSTSGSTVGATVLTFSSCGGGTLQNAYDNSSSPATILTSSTAKKFLIQAGATFDSPTMFQLQDSAGNNVLSAGNSNSTGSARNDNVTLFNDFAGDTGTWATSGNPLSQNTEAAGTVSLNGYIYEIGGLNTVGPTYYSSVYYAQIGSKGANSAWTTTTVLPGNRSSSAAAASNGYIYVIGGRDSTTRYGTVFYAKANADGSLGAWQTANPLPGAAVRTYSTAMVYNGYLYDVDGYDGSTVKNTIFYAKINADGSIGNWVTNTITSPSADQGQTIVQANGFMYLLGGVDAAGTTFSNGLFYAPIGLDGRVGSWTTNVSTLPAQIAWTGAQVANGNLYVIAGTGPGGVTNNVYYSQLLPSGAVSTGTILTSGNHLPGSIGVGGSILANNYIYYVGGDSGSNSAATVYYAPLQGVQVEDGSIDLLYNATSTYSTSLASPGHGGSITAANGTFVGTLQVQDQANFVSSVGIGGALSVGGGVAVQGNTEITGSIDLNQITAPSGTVTVTPQGTGGVVTWSYVVTAVDGNGNETPASATGTTTLGNANLTTSNYNHIIWNTVPGATSYKIYRTAVGTSPSSLGLIATVTAGYGNTQTLDDLALVGGGGSAPTINPTGSLSVQGNLSDTGTALFENASNSTTAFNIQNASGLNVLSVDTTLGNVNLGVGSLQVKGVTLATAPTLVGSASGGTLTNATTYYYLVAAVGAGGEGFDYPTNPTSYLTTTAASSVALSWTAATGATSYLVYRSTDNINWKFINVGNVTSYNDTSNAPWTVTGTRHDFSATGNIYLPQGGGIYLNAGGTMGVQYSGAINAMEFSNFQTGSGIALYSDNFKVVDSTGFNTSLVITNTGATTFRDRSDSATDFQIQNSGGVSLLTADTNAGNIQIGSSTTNATANLLILDSYNSGTDPTGTTGAMYYNTNLGAFRCFTTSWANCGGAGGGTLQNAYDNSTTPATITTSSSTKGVLLKAGATFDSTTLFQVENSGSLPLFGINSSSNNNNNLLTNPDIESAISGNWTAKNGSGTSTPTQVTSPVYNGSDSLQVVTSSTATNAGVTENVSLSSNSYYDLAFYVNSLNGFVTTGGASSFDMGFGSAGTDTSCITNPVKITAGSWTRVTCGFYTGTLGATPYVYVKQTDATGKTWYIDAAVLETDANATSKWQNGKITLNGTIASPVVITPLQDSTNSLDVQNSSGINVFQVDTTDTNLIRNPGMEVNTTGWTYSGTQSATVGIYRDVTNSYLGVADLKFIMSATATDQARYTFSPSTVLQAGTTYTMSFFAKDSATSYSTLTFGRREGAADSSCVTTGFINTTWQRYSCSFTWTTISSPYLYISAGTASKTLFIDSVVLEPGTTATPYGAGSIYLNGVITSPVNFQNKTDSTAAFQIDNSFSTPIFSVDTANNKITLATGAGTAATVLILGNKTDTDSLTPGATTCPTSGAIYYNSNDGEFRGCKGGKLYNLIAGVDVGDFTQGATWFKPVGAQVVMVVVCGGGGGGGGGHTGATNTARDGGGGGGGGAHVERVFSAANLTSTVTVTPASSVAGGLASSVGTNGQASTFGAYVSAAGGGGGVAGAAGAAGSGGGGGGLVTNGQVGQSAANSAGGEAAGGAAGAVGTGWSGGGGQNTGQGQPAQFGGGAGGGMATTPSTGFNGGGSIVGGGGGGSGGGTNATNVNFAGGPGGNFGIFAGGGGGAGGALGTNPGTAGSGGSSTNCGSGGGGGGGGGAGTGGAGGAGGATTSAAGSPGGGGGGGGGGITGGAGGAGARGEVWVYTW